MASMNVNDGSEFDYLLKILVIGDSGVGKSSIISKLCHGKMQDSYISTIGVDFNIKTITIDSKIFKLQIWDTAGQERFRAVTTSYYRGAIGVLMVFDVSDKISFDNIKIWMNEINNHAGENICKFLVGNKNDVKCRQVTSADAIEYADKIGCVYHETSAKIGNNIDSIFKEICSSIYKERICEKQDIEKEVVITCGDSIDKKSCCF